MADKTNRAGVAIETHDQFLPWLAPAIEKLPKSSVMAALVAAIHVFLAAPQRRKTWMAEASPAMTPNEWLNMTRTRLRARAPTPSPAGSSAPTHGSAA